MMYAKCHPCVVGRLSYMKAALLASELHIHNEETSVTGSIAGITVHPGQAEAI